MCSLSSQITDVLLLDVAIPVVPLLLTSMANPSPIFLKPVVGSQLSSFLVTFVYIFFLEYQYIVLLEAYVLVWLRS